MSRSAVPTGQYPDGGGQYFTEADIGRSLSRLPLEGILHVCPDSGYTGDEVPFICRMVGGERHYLCQHKIPPLKKGDKPHFCTVQVKHSQSTNISSLFAHSKRHWKAPPKALPFVHRVSPIVKRNQQTINTMEKINGPTTIDTSEHSPYQSQQLSVINSFADNKRTKPILYVQHDYHDYACVPYDNVPVDCVSQYQKKHKGGINILFPEKLHHILSDDSGDVISWAPHGRCFFINDHEKILTNYLQPRFGINTYASFHRQLNRYNFKLITNKGSRDVGAYYHEMFLRSRPKLCQHIRGRKFKRIFNKPLPNPNCEPDFYCMVPCFTLTEDAEGIVVSNTNREGNSGRTKNHIAELPGEHDSINATALTASPQVDPEQTSL